MPSRDAWMSIYGSFWLRTVSIKALVQWWHRSSYLTRPDLQLPSTINWYSVEIIMSIVWWAIIRIYCIFNIYYIKGIMCSRYAFLSHTSAFKYRLHICVNKTIIVVMAEIPHISDYGCPLIVCLSKKSYVIPFISAWKLTRLSGHV